MISADETKMLGYPCFCCFSGFLLGLLRVVLVGMLGVGVGFVFSDPSRLRVNLRMDPSLFQLHDPILKIRAKLKIPERQS